MRGPARLGHLCRGRSPRQDAAGRRMAGPAARRNLARRAVRRRGLRSIGAGQHLAPPRPGCSGLLAPGLADVGEFPFELWAGSWRGHGGGRPGRWRPVARRAGYLALRQAIADYLRLLRGVRCEAEQVIIVSGTRQRPRPDGSPCCCEPGRDMALAGESRLSRALRGPLESPAPSWCRCPSMGKVIDLAKAPVGRRRGWSAVIALGSSVSAWA